MTDKIKIALEFMRNKQSFLVDDIRLGVNEMDIVEVTGWSQFTNFSNLTKLGALEELGEIKLLFLKMVASSIELEDFIKTRKLKFNLWFDDLGKASIRICSEENGLIHWDATIKG
jgi:hypothetical protein